MGQRNRNYSTFNFIWPFSLILTNVLQCISITYSVAVKLHVLIKAANYKVCIILCKTNMIGGIETLPFHPFVRNTVLPYYTINNSSVLCCAAGFPWNIMQVWVHVQ
jgi:hypothetical protein